MSCLTVARIHEFLEGFLSPQGEKEVRLHLAQCPQCARALDERRRLQEASRSLPIWDLPPGFTQSALEAAYAGRTASGSGIRSSLIGLAAMMIFIFGYLFLSGQTLMDFLIQANHTLIDIIRNLSVVAARSIKFLAVIVKVLSGIASAGLKILLHLNSLFSPEFQICLISLTMFISFSLLWIMRKRFFSGERV